MIMNFRTSNKKAKVSPYNADNKNMMCKNRDKYLTFLKMILSVVSVRKYVKIKLGSERDCHNNKEALYGFKM